MKNYFSVGSFVAGIMLGVFFAGTYFLGDDTLSLPLPILSTGKQALNSPFSELENTNLPTRGSGAVSVVDQLAGTTVAVESVTVPPPGVWVAVREVTGRNLGNVLGAVRVDGPKSAVSVPLLRATEPNRPYAIQLYRDDGDGSFDLARNSAYVDFDTGASVIAYFKTTP